VAPFKRRGVLSSCLYKNVHDFLRIFAKNIADELTAI